MGWSTSGISRDIPWQSFQASHTPNSLLQVFRLSPFASCWFVLTLSHRPGRNLVLLVTPRLLCSISTRLWSPMSRRYWLPLPNGWWFQPPMLQSA
jgi:hypothetical protein